MFIITKHTVMPAWLWVLILPLLMCWWMLVLMFYIFKYTVVVSVWLVAVVPVLIVRVKNHGKTIRVRVTNR